MCRVTTTTAKNVKIKQIYVKNAKDTDKNKSRNSFYDVL